MRELHFHEVSNIFPMMTAAEYRELKVDIEKNGLREPIWIYEDQIVDGRNRYNACKELGIEPAVREWDGRGSLISFVISENLQRRHLTSEQKACVAVEALPYFDKEAKERQREAGKRFHRGKSKVMEKIPQPNGDENLATGQAAKRFNTNSHYVRDAKKIKQKAPELFKQVRSGKMKLKDAKKELRRQEFAAKATGFEKEPSRQLGLVEIHCADGRELSRFVQPNSAQLVITSPPYNVGIGYRVHNDSMESLQYQEMLSAVFQECFKALCEGGRIAVVVPFGVGRHPWVPFAPIIMDLLRGNHFVLRGQIVWHKGTLYSSTAWGTYRSPTDPILRDTNEVIVVAHKGNGCLEVPSSIWSEDEAGKHSMFLKDPDDFMRLVTDYWYIHPESAQRVGHPAPFPVELASRLIRLYAYPEALIVDPFCGSGSTLIAATQLGCRGIGVDLDAAYCGLARERLNECLTATAVSS